MNPTPLSETELQIAALVGCTRHIKATAAGRRPTHGAPKHDDWRTHVGGAAAEMAAAKALGVYWPASTDPDYQGDIGTAQTGMFHVRSTNWNGGHLLLHHSDPDDALFVLVVGEAPCFRLAGWIRAGDGKRAELWRGDIPNPCFMVPQRELNPWSRVPLR